MKYKVGDWLIVDFCKPNFTRKIIDIIDGEYYAEIYKYDTLELVTDFSDIVQPKIYKNGLLLDDQNPWILDLKTKFNQEIKEIIAEGDKT